MVKLYAFSGIVGQDFFFIFSPIGRKPKEGVANHLMYLYIVFHIKYNMIITDDCEENVVLKGERGVILTSWMQEWDKR